MFAVASVSWAEEPAPAPQGPLDSRPPVYVADGPEEIWKSRCEMCHGPEGKARTAIGRKTKAKDLTDPAWQRGSSDDDLRAIIGNGVQGTKMRGYRGKMSAAQLEGLVQTIRKLEGKPAAPAITRVSRPVRHPQEPDEVP